MARPKLTLKEAADAWIDRYTKRKGPKHKTTQSKRESCQYFVRDFGKLLVQSITMEHVETFLYDTVSDIWSPATWNARMIDLRAMFKWFELRGFIPAGRAAHLFADINVKRFIAAPKVRLTAKQANETIEATKNPRDRIFLVLLLNLACRKSELQNAKISDLRRDENGKWILEIRRVKNYTRDAIKLMPNAQRELDMWLMHYRERCGQLDPDWYLVPARIGGRRTRTEAGTFLPELPLNPTRKFTSQDDMIGKVLEKVLGHQPPQQKSHLFRRTAARLILDHLTQRGVTESHALPIVQKLLGHSSLEVTRNYIGWHTEDQLRDLAFDEIDITGPDNDPGAVLPQAVPDNVVDIFAPRTATG